jgi:hypothetical protein
MDTAKATGVEVACQETGYASMSIGPHIEGRMLRYYPSPINASMSFRESRSLSIESTIPLASIMRKRLHGEKR